MTKNDLHFAVVVGIDRYPEIRDLSAAVNDAKDFAKWTKDPEGGNLPAHNVKTIVTRRSSHSSPITRENARPKRDNIYNELFSFRTTVEERIQANPDDWEKTRLYIYVAGHGIAPEPKDAALLMADAGPGQYGYNIGCRNLVDFFLKSQSFHEVVVFADCCRERVDNVTIGIVPWDEVKRQNGRIQTLQAYATYFGDIAQEEPLESVADPDDLRGYFTKALLEGLRGKAVDGPRQRIDSNNLSAFVAARVQELTETRPRKQIPDFDANPAEPIIFRDSTPGTVVEKYQISLSFITLPDSDLTLLGPNGEPQETWAPNIDPWFLTLPKGLYQVVRADNQGELPVKDNGFFRVVGEDRNVTL